MIIGILSVKNHRYHPNRRLLEAAKALKHQALILHPGKLFMGINDAGLGIVHITRRFRVDVVIPRIGATIKEYGLSMIRHLELLGIPVINNYSAILLARNKFLSLQTLSRQGMPVPETRYASNGSNFDKAVFDLGGFPVVIKASSGRQGEGVFRMDTPKKSRHLLKNLLNKGRGVLIQEFIPPENRKDIRVLVVGEKVVGAMALKPRKGDFRANIHLSGLAEKTSLTKDMTALALNSTKALGLDIAGVDMIEESSGDLRVIEVNYAPGFRGLESCTGEDVASEIIRYAAREGNSRTTG